MVATPAAGGTTPLNVTIRITTTGVRSATSGMGAVTNASQKMTRGMGQGVITARTLVDSMRMTASLMKYTVAGGFMKIGKAAVDAYRNFELTFSRIRGLVGISTIEIAKMKKGVLELSGATAKGPEELAEALYFITSSGIRESTTVMDVLKNSAKASAAGLGEVRVVADALTSALNAYGKGNLAASTATDILVAAVREGKAEADTFAPAFSKVLPVSAAFGASFNDVAAAMAALTRSGMTAGTAGIYVRQVLSQLLKPSKQAKDALAGIGTSAEAVRAEIQEKGLFQGLTSLSQKLGGTEEGAENFAKVFGNVRALTAMLQLTGPAAAENEEIFRRMSNTTGDLDFAFEAYADTVDRQFNKATAEARVTLIKLGEALKPLVVTLLTAAQSIYKFFARIIDLLGGTFSKILVITAGSAVVLAAAMAMIIQTGSALIRLFANVIMSLTGSQIMYDAQTKSLYRLSSAHMANATATHTNTLAQKGYTKVNILSMLTLKGLRVRLMTVARAHYASAIAAGAHAGGLLKLRVAAIMAGTGFKILGRAMLSLLTNPIFLAIAGITLALTGLFVMFKKLNATPMSKLAGSIGKVNELLGQTVAYGQIKIGVDIDANNVQAQAKATAVEEIKEQIQEQSPELLGELEKLGDTSKEALLRVLGGLMKSQYAAMGDTQKQALLTLFAQQFGFNESDIKNVIIGNVSGDLVADAVIEVAVNAARGADKDFSDAMTASGKTGMDAFIIALEGADTRSLDVLGDFGSGFVDQINQTANMTPLLHSLKALDKAGQLTADTFEYAVGNALEGLSGDLNVAKEESGNFIDIFAHKDNEGALLKMIAGTTQITDMVQVNLILKNIKADMDALTGSEKTAAKGYEILNSHIGKYIPVLEESSTATQAAVDEHEAIQTAIREEISAYKEAEDRIKKYTEALRASKGIKLTRQEAQLDRLDTNAELAKDFQKDGTGLDITTEKGRENQERLMDAAKAAEEFASIVAEQEGAEAGAAALTRGYLDIFAVVAETGGDVAAAAASEFLTGLGYTVANFEAVLTSQADPLLGTTIALGEDIAAGVSTGIEGFEGKMSLALIRSIYSTIQSAKHSLEIESPSKVFAKQLGIPMAMGIGVGFEGGMKSAGLAMKKSLNKTLTNLMSTGTTSSVGKFLEDFMKKKKDVETPAQEFVKSTVGRMKDIIGSLGSYIKSQLSFRESQAGLAKLINTQRSYDDQKKKSARQVQYSTTRLGADGGAMVTSYEQAQIDELQTNFERVSRDYAMGRATYVDLVDAEIELFEARAASKEISDDVVGAQNAFLDSSVRVENRNLELAGSQTDVMSAFLDVQEASALLYMNHGELNGVYNNLATATGIASGKIVVGSTDLQTLGTTVESFGGYVSAVGTDVFVTGQAFNSNFYGEGGIFATLQSTGTTASLMLQGIGAGFTDLSAGLLDPEGDMFANLRLLGSAIFNAIQMGATESMNASVLTPKGAGTAAANKRKGVKKDNKGDGKPPSTDPKGSAKTSVSQFTADQIYKAISLDQTKFNVFKAASVNRSAAAAAVNSKLTKSMSPLAMDKFQVTKDYANLVDSQLKLDFLNSFYKLTGKAVGGSVRAMSPYMVGERGPEMFLPQVSGTIVSASALDRYVRTPQKNPVRDRDSASNSIAVTVNNPVPAAAEESITRRMKVLANSGLFG